LNTPTSHSKSSLKEKLRYFAIDSFNGRSRIVAAWVFAVLIIFSADRYPNTPGILIAFLGATLRFWASGYLRKDKVLTVSGPYRFTRNPLYLGTYLIAIGAVISIEAWITGVFLTVFYFLMYDMVVEFEENNLIQYFGEPYKKFCARVPRFFGFKLPLSDREMKELSPGTAQFSYEAIQQNKALEAYWSFLGMIIALALIAYLRIEYLKF